MAAEMIGTVIAKLRKEKGVTQDELAKAVSVSAQAVSKWENGGVPDTDLLPGIADFFGVSIDTLFGRSITDYSDIENALARKLILTKPDERFESAFELCWVIERALFGSPPENESVKDYREELGATEQRYSSVLSDNGYTRMGIANRLQYFLIVPETKDKEIALFNGIDYVSLFRDLSDKTLFDALVLLDKRDSKKSFTPNLLVKNLGLDFDKSLEIIRTLQKYGLIRMTQIETDDVTQEVYSFKPTPSFISMLIFAREMIDKPNNFVYFSGGRNKPYLS